VISWFLLFLAAAVVSLVVTFPIVWALEFFKLTQHVREEGPSSHKSKAGTITMGGIGFVATIIAFALIFIDYDLKVPYLALILLIFGFAVIGLIDDLIKVYQHKNQGLTFWQKIILQMLFAGLFSGFLLSLGQHNSVSGVLKIIWLANPVFYFLFSVFMIVGSANATNLTDGLNGLLAGTSAVAFLAFAFLSQKAGIEDAATFSLVAAGAVFAFLYFNFPKAKLFMGDVGSLPIGAALAGIALIIHRELWLIVIGGVFLVEALSVILQVTSYKLFKRRIFKMTPLHHHFELMGYKETAVVVGFWVSAVILGVIGVLI
jgi:phospho-N-acetylmuramoyl-pentapeptide-transferase